ncbi:AraC family transcriptional regulator [Ktedonosporobacter rubrisoli]|uniref:AraC family transcriptional regulator n=1 Tax=Ktedonosporobacter rubrisoli TaxID=2509675 RepID=A0A4P6JKJ5_KTERU|nr:helix-turn-helix transcriptional regulator [Ktedonosporobacter rubrisoli]QBD75675.1 AraC family transcriptional regulator [Ktedonosporobacter rubrisoli]
MYTSSFQAPHLNALFEMNPARLSNGWTQLREFGAGDLDDRLLNTDDEQQGLARLIHFLSARLEQVNARDLLVEETLRFIHNTISSLHVKDVLQYVHLSERQFEKRFTQAVGISPQSYIRVRHLAV